MNEDVIQGKWKQIKGDVKAKWGKLTDDKLDQVDGNREKLIGTLQECYGKSRQDIEDELNEFEKKYAA